MQIYDTFFQFPLSIKLLWFSIVLQFILIIIPLIRCVYYGSELTTCAYSLEMRITVLLLLFTPLAIYMTHTHMKLTQGQGLFDKNPFLKYAPTQSGDLNVIEAPNNNTQVVRNNVLKNNKSVVRKNVPKNKPQVVINDTTGSITNQVQIAPAKNLEMFETARKF